MTYSLVVAGAGVAALAAALALRALAGTGSRRAHRPRAALLVPPAGSRRAVRRGSRPQAGVDDAAAAAGASFSLGYGPIDVATGAFLTAVRRRRLRRDSALGRLIDDGAATVRHVSAWRPG